MSTRCSSRGSAHSTIWSARRFRRRSRSCQTLPRCPRQCSSRRRQFHPPFRRCAQRAHSLSLLHHRCPVLERPSCRSARWSSSTGLPHSCHPLVSIATAIRLRSERTRNRHPAAPPSRASPLAVRSAAFCRWQNDRRSPPSTSATGDGVDSCTFPFPTTHASLQSTVRAIPRRLPPRRARPCSCSKPLPVVSSHPYRLMRDRLR